MCVCIYVCGQYPLRPEKGVLYLGAEVIRGCELPRGYRELNLSSARAAKILTTEPSLAPGTTFKKKKTLSL